jgi:single-strand DNA-binding protein
MINDLTKTLQIGRLGADPKQQSENAPTVKVRSRLNSARNNLSSVAVTFSIATSDKWTDDNNNRQQRTDWHTIVVFGNLRTYAKKLKKGDRVFVEGKLRNNHYEKEVGSENVTIYNTEILASAIELLAAKETDEN